MTEVSLSIPDSKLNSKKISVSFTWDDNSIQHFDFLRKVFNKHNFKCSFYVVPGTIDFETKYYKGYLLLNNEGFEIGSHSYTHKWMTTLSLTEVETEFNLAVKLISKYFKKYPTTFAFPNHDFNTTLLDISKKYHLETRNTLRNSVRFSMKTRTTLNELKDTVRNAIKDNVNIVFSGHSILNSSRPNQLVEGYEPINSQIIDDFLLWLRPNEKIDVITFEKSSLKEFIKKYGKKYDKNWLIEENLICNLEKISLSKNYIKSLFE